MLQFQKHLLIFLSIICHSKCVNCIERRNRPLPIVLWHGLGSDHSSNLRQLIRDNIGNDVYIKSIQLASNGFEDTEMTILLHPNIQISTVCQQIALDENLSNGFHAIGFSQGSQFL
jgi:palmitoyl-protein thioesterase